MTMPTNVRLMALVLLLWVLSILQPLSPASASTDSPTLDKVISEYDKLKPQVLAVVTAMREGRKVGQAIESGTVLLVRKDVGDLVKTLRRYDKDHLRAAKGLKTYPDREKVLRLFHVCDAIHRLLEAETKATDFQKLGLKYEEMWRQADTALTGSENVDR